MTILQGDCLDILPTLEAQSVQCCVTSPPYWGLRDYGTATWEGGSEECDHLENIEAKFARRDGGKERDPNGFHGTPNVELAARPYRSVCAKCGARRNDSQLGLEATPEEYLTKMVAVFREVWRVLKDDGTLWANMGDSYASGQTGFGASGGSFESERKQWTESPARQRREIPCGLKPKDLCGIPWRLAFALQADGWYLRSDIIWHKPNPMPESVTDRPTKAHEYIFLLSKAERYFYDADAIREPAGEIRAPRMFGAKKQDGTFRQDVGNMCQDNGSRNKRSVWTVATQPYGEAHFATFPEDLIKPCILAGSRVGDTVLDPFAGSGTTGKVATELGRESVLIELNPAYVEMIYDRTNVTAGML